MDDKNPLFRILSVVGFDVPCDLQTDGSFSRSLFSEDYRSGRFTGITEDFIPGGMVGVDDAMFFEDLIGFCIFLSKGIP